MTLRTRKLLATTSLLALAAGATACEASVDEDGAELDIEQDE